MNGEPDTYAITRPRTRWWRYDITITEPAHRWHWRESDPAEALYKARNQLCASSQRCRCGTANAFAHPDAITHLHDGRSLRAVCDDGTVIAVTPTLT